MSAATRTPSTLPRSFASVSSTLSDPWMIRMIFIALSFRRSRPRGDTATDSRYLGQRPISGAGLQHIGWTRPTAPAVSPMRRALHRVSTQSLLHWPMLAGGSRGEVSGGAEGGSRKAPIFGRLVQPTVIAHEASITGRFEGPERRQAT